DHGRAIWANGNVIQLLPETYENTVFTVHDLIKVMDDASIDRAVLLQGGFLGFDNHCVAAAVRMYPQRLRGAVAVDPFCRNLEGIVSHVKTLGLRAAKFEVSTGCGLMGAHRTFDIACDAMLSLYSSLADTVMTFAFDLGSPGDESHQVEGIRMIASHFPERNIVVCHLASPKRGQDENIKWELEMLSLDNVFFDTAALFWKTRPESYPFDTARRYLSYARNIVGAEHLMWGSDMPSTLPMVPLSEQISYSSGIFTSSEEEWYFGKTADKVYFS
ncbi:MAG: amidohydrolase family protein, partial [Bullifex sp.]